MHSQSSFDPVLVGVGAIIGAVIIALAIWKKLVPQERVKGLWIISAIGALAGIMLIISA